MKMIEGVSYRVKEPSPGFRKLPDRYFAKRCFEEVEIPFGFTEIGEGCFAFCKELRKITIPRGVTKIGKFCFEYCTSLESITIPNSVKEIGYGCFNHCRSLKEITIPNSLIHIAYNMDYLYCCDSLEKVIIAKSKPPPPPKVGDIDRNTGKKITMVDTTPAGDGVAYRIMVDESDDDLDWIDN